MTITWTEAVLDDLYTGDKIRITNRAGRTGEGRFVGIDACRYSLLFMPVIRAKASRPDVEIPTRDIARIERAMCEGA